MIVPPFVPPQIEISGNVAQESYNVRLGFLRRVVGIFGFSVGIVAACSFVPLNVGSYGWVAVFASLLALSLARAIAKGRAFEQNISAIVSAAVFLSLGLTVRQLVQEGWPAWTIAVGIASLILYAVSCGRDFSFMGMYLLSLAGSTIFIVVAGSLIRTIPMYLVEAALVNTIYLSYWVYDLAALQTRRRLGEEIGAVLDLYRDVLNMFSYPIRVWEHWRAHRIWSRP